MAVQDLLVQSATHLQAAGDPFLLLAVQNARHIQVAGDPFLKLTVQNATHRHTSTNPYDETFEGDAEWWPGYPDENKMYRHPAFQVGRDLLGYVEGGDWVRGSVPQFVGLLAGTATALPTGGSLPLNSLWLLGSPVPTAAPSPPAPTAKAAGQAIFWDGTAWTNVGVLTVPVQTAIRYPTATEEADAAVAAERGVLYCRPYDYHTVELFWGIPGKVFENWAEVVIVRSAFGYPDTVNDGQVIFRKTKLELFPDNYVPEGTVFPPVYDLRHPLQAGVGQLTSGRYYYYSLFFRVSLEWKRSFTTSTLLPRDHHHADHLWKNLPPYYQWIDEQQGNEAGADGHLRKFLRVFGFELDQTREYVENWQELYHIDFCPSPLLRRLGPNFGVNFESGIGEIRYRSLLSQIGTLYGIRGTRPCLERVCQAVSKYECEVTQTANLMTLPDDSDFFEGTGNWAGLNPLLNPDTVLGFDTSILDPDRVFLKSTKEVLPPVGYGRSVMEVYTSGVDEKTDVLITCGCGIAYDQYQGRDEVLGTDYPYGPRYIYPLQVGILADNAGVYAFSCQIKKTVDTVVDVMILWYDTDGGVMDYVGRTVSVATTPPTTGWTAFQCTGAVPAGAVYAVPAIHLSARLGWPGDDSPPIYIAGCGVYNLGSAKRISSEGPNPYLEMGNEFKRMGGPIAVPPAPQGALPALPTPYPGYQIGAKKA